MAVELRIDDPPRDGTLVLVHMGAGAADSVVKQSLSRYDEYRSIGAGGYGIFAVSLFALADGVTLDTVLAALPQKQYGVSTIGQVRDHFELLPTTVTDPLMPPEIVDIQHVHYDAVLPHPALPGLIHRDPIDLVQGDRTALEAALRTIVEQAFLPLFVPRMGR